MTARLEWLNALAAPEARRVLLECCGSEAWAARMVAMRPFASVPEVLESAAQAWRALGEADWLEAFAAHPRIGERSASEASSREQAAVYSAAQRTRDALEALNAQYEEKFGFIFIVFATGKTPDEMLAILQERLHNTRATELATAAAEQVKITRLRLERLLTA